MFTLKRHYKTENKNHAIILIHGLIRTTRSMRRLANFLNKHGYDCYLYSYESAKLTIVEHSAELLKNVQKLLETNPDTKFSFITHSLGGILARDALSNIDSKHRKQIDRMVLLAPPNKGSRLATIAVKSFPFLANWIKPLSELRDHPSAYVHQVKTPGDIEIGIIAARLDIKTPPAVTRLDQQKDFMIVTSTHTFIMNQPVARRAMLRFIETGSFLR
jgi:alpha-beta hydrolase superfamily lysophospholipase